MITQFHCWLLLLCAIAVAPINAVSRAHIVNSPVGDVLTLDTWDILAPFPSAARETGADPIQAWGGIFEIPRADSSTYPSDIVNGGFAGWTTITGAAGQVSIQYNDTFVNWPLIESWAGSAGSSWMGWGLSDFSLDSDSAVVVSCQGASYFYVDSRLLNSDKYYSGISQTTLYLSQGTHTFFVLISGSETAQFGCSVALAPKDPWVMMNDVLVPDVVDGALASEWISIVVSNNLNESLSSLQVDVTSISDPNNKVTVTQQFYPTLLQGQTYAVKFAVQSTNLPIECSSANQFNITLGLSADGFPVQTVDVVLSCKQFSDPYVFTFLDFDQSVQYSPVRAPAKECPSGGCPVILTLHGAGVESKYSAWTNAYQQQNYSWILFPTNRRNYGWDWQGPGLLNALTTLDYFVNNLPGVNATAKKLFYANPDLILYAGHSMGGHGCWTISTHYPDKAIAVVPAAGWISMRLYQPYFLRIGNSWTDPYVQMIMTQAISDYDDDFYTPHLVGIPLMIRMGSDDDNVPPYHLRRMARLVDELSGNPHNTLVSEIPGQGHWFNGVVDDPIIQAFFDENLPVKALPALPSKFTVVTMNPATSGGKGGIRIQQQLFPFRASRIQVQRVSNETWTLRTENVKRFTIATVSPYASTDIPQTINVDGQLFNVTEAPSSYNFVGSSWQLVEDNGEWVKTERGPNRYDPSFPSITYSSSASF
eukprot:TRINITY_DN7825_c0_g1_i2.p1 TRINITY_DN7825_c0_g1~~TRINITY_DN7825_c0_g1_i2.p1  ORF type:complete len:706 (+),score=177.42 TRINITY_DN7825_c0_g1_i2:3-2120(+)